ncbi:hypothetical protein HDU97_010030 [Phlyctochytrium planicorne]|nr:hypothetical protein HDU97_010030 [Phlyctochytrium planicorne]
MANSCYSIPQGVVQRFLNTGDYYDCNAFCDQDRAYQYLGFSHFIPNNGPEVITCYCMTPDHFKRAKVVQAFLPNTYCSVCPELAPLINGLCGFKKPTNLDASLIIVPYNVLPFVGMGLNGDAGCSGR